jgi:ribosome-associated protein
MRSNNPGLRVRSYSIPAEALLWRFGPTGGPGGQHANKVNTRVELRFDLAGSDVFPEVIRDRILDRLKTVDGVILVVVDETRSQWRNRVLARRRLAEILEDAMRTQRQRRPTKPTPSSQRGRLRSKKLRGNLKVNRQRPEIPED